ncbi:putative ribonuclease H-like superfamily [Dioscorea sansibarensis]
MSEVYGHIKQYIKKYAEIYEGDVVVRIMIRVYMEGKKMDRPALSEEARYSLLSSIAEQEFLVKEPVTRGGCAALQGISQHSKHLALNLKAFMVGDIETLLIDDVHKPYAAGLLKVRPGEEIKDIMVESYFSEDYSLILDSFEERSTKVLYDLVLRIATIAREEKKTLTIYFHNFSRFDGIILLRHLACHHQNYKVKALLC